MCPKKLLQIETMKTDGCRFTYQDYILKTVFTIRHYSPDEQALSW